QVEPWFAGLLSGAVDWDLVMRPQRRHAFPGPTITMPGTEIVAIEDAGDQIVAADAHQHSYRLDDVFRRAVALPAPASREAQLRMHPTHPVDEQDDLACLGVDVGDHL